MEQEQQSEPTAHPMQVKANGKESVGSYRIECYTHKDAVVSGIKMFLVTLIAAIISVILPGVHFVSVPLGILASPLVGIYFYRARKGKPKRMTADINCPECNENNHVTSRLIESHYACKCAHCQHDLHMTPA